MINVKPQGDIYLCKTPLENDYKNQLTFNNTTEQINYFNSKVVKSVSNYTYVRESQTINFGENIDNINTCNYLFYRNTGFSNKYYYCFITNMEYVNENTTRITIETDVYQTWMFQIQYKRCFVEREHVSNDNVGAHTIPEGLELGDYVINNVHSDSLNDLNYKIHVLSTSGQANDSYANMSKFRSGTPHSCSLTSYDYTKNGLLLLGANTQGHTSTATTGTDDQLLKWAQGITSIFILPEWVDAGVETLSPITEYVGVNDITSLNGYTPKNKKLLTYPYCYYLVSNGQGGTAIYKNELWNKSSSEYISNKKLFQINATFTPGGSIYGSPYHYNGSNDSYPNNEGLPLGKFPQLSWKTDAYNIWLSQNQMSREIGLFSNLTSVSTGFGNKNVDQAQGGLMGIWNMMAQDQQAQLVPNSAHGNINCGDIASTQGNICYKFYYMTIKQEYAKIIDNYFNAFGYKVNDVKIPNLTTRLNWNFVKTIDCNFEGDIPQTSLNKIRDMFNNGVTLWHNPSTFENYSQPNNVV